MHAKQLAVAACILVVAALAAIAIAVHYLDPRALATSLAASVKADTGRELQFGDVGVKFLPQPAIVLSGVRLGNAAWGSQPWLAQADRVSADIDALALLTGRVRIKHIAMTDAKVLLETDRDGNGNWAMGRAGAATPAWLTALEIDEIALETLAFTYRDGTTGETTSAQIDSARIAADSASGPIHVSARGNVDGKSIEATGTVGALSALIANALAYPVDVEGKFGAATASVHGAIDQPREFGGFKLALRAQMPEFADFAALFGAKVPPLGPLRGATQLTGTMAAPVFSGIEIELGTPERMGLTARGDLAGTQAANGTYEWKTNGVDFTLQGAQMSDLALWFGKPLPTGGQYRIAARMTGSTSAPALSAIDATLGGRGSPEIKLRGGIANVRAASGVDLTLTAAATNWWRPGAAADAPRLPPFRASARVRDAKQGYRVEDLEIKIADSSVSASLQVARIGPRLRVTGKASSPLIDLARLPPAPAAASASAAATATPRPSDHWKLADADLDLKVARLVLPDGRQVQAGSGRLVLDNGRLAAHALQATLGGATVKLDGSINEPQNLAGLDLDVALQGGELAELFRFFGKSIAPAGPYHGRAQVHGSFDAIGMSGIDSTAGRPGQSLRATGKIEDAMNWRGIQLALTANVGDSVAAGRLIGAELPRLPALRATARVSGPQGGYVFDDLKLALGRTSVQGRLAFVPGASRPRVTANLGGPLIDLSELPPMRTKPDGTSPLLAADVDADVRFDRIVLPDRRALGPVSGGMQLAAGTVGLKQFTVAVEGASAVLDGRINDPLKPAGIELMVNAQLTRGTGLSAFTGQRLQNLPAFTASGKLTDAPNGYALTGLKLAAPAATIAGDVSLTRGARRFKVSAKTSSPLLDIYTITHAAGSAKPAAPGTRVIPDVPLPLEVLRVADADLDLRFDQVKLDDAQPLGALLVRATIEDGVLKAEPVQLTVQAGQMLSVSGTVDAAHAAWALRVDGKGIDFGEMLARFGRAENVKGGSTDLTMQLQGRGKSLSAILGSLNGEARMKVGPHHIQQFNVDLNTPIVLRIFGLSDPSKKSSPGTDVKCFAARVPIRNGVVTSERNVAAETADYNAVMSGTLNLRTEAIDGAVTPVVNGEVKVIVRLGGTLAAPTVSVDSAGAIMKSTVSAGAAVMTFGGSWMLDTLLRKSTSDPSPCATALAQ